LLQKKKGDQRRFENQRPITLLNAIYKIASKVYQIWLTEVLPSLISPQQVACVQGRNIHHGLLFMNKCLHFAELSSLDHVLAKLDINKAFDYVEWPFMLQLLEKLGFGTKFLLFLKASFANATSAVQFNGRTLEYFSISRSVRQGDPLSPILFIIVIDALIRMFKHLLDIGSLKGVYIPPIDQQGFHNMYADDIAIIICAEMPYILEMMHNFAKFSAALGLNVIWNQTKSAFLSKRALPAHLEQLGWEGEPATNASKLLGFPIGQQISAEQIREMLNKKLESLLDQSKRNLALLIGRVTISNHWILASVWFLLSLHASELEELDQMQQ
jgi:hypothetical protein